MAITKATRNWIIETAQQYNLMEEELFNNLLNNKRFHMQQGLNEQQAIRQSKKNIIEHLKRKILEDEKGD